jgi:hypothetical protein
MDFGAALCIIKLFEILLLLLLLPAVEKQKQLSHVCPTMIQFDTSATPMESWAVQTTQVSGWSQNLHSLVASSSPQTLKCSFYLDS